MEQRPYVAYMLYRLGRFRLLLLLPFLRITLQLFRGEMPHVSPQEWIVGGVLCAYVWLQWRVCRYRLQERAEGQFHTIGVRQGIVWRRSLHISADEATSVEIECTPLLRLLRGRRVSVSTAGLRRRADVQLYLSAGRTAELYTPCPLSFRYRAGRLPVLILSLTGSNAAVGLLAAAPTLGQAGRLLGARLSVDTVGRLVGLGLPWLMRACAYLLLLGWSVAAVRTWFRYVGFAAQRESGCLHITSGLLTRREVLIDRDKITAVEWRQTLSMRLFSLYTAVITAAGYGRDIGTRPVLVPAARAEALTVAIQRLLPEFPSVTLTVHAMRTARWRYVLAPLCLLVGALPLWVAGTWWRLLAVPWSVLGVWWFAVRLCGYRDAAFDYGDRAVLLCYPRGLALYRITVPLSAVDCVSVSQSILQRRRGTCTVRVRCFGEKKRIHRVWGVPRKAVWQAIKKQYRP